MGQTRVGNSHKAPRPTKGVNNDEIRLSILCQYYRARYSGKIRPAKLDLDGVDHATVDANMGYLVGKGLINGKTNYTSGGNVFVTTGDITYRGTEVVEDIMKRSLHELEPAIRDEIKGEESDGKMLDKLYEKCVKSAPVCEVVVKVAHAILTAPVPG